MYLRVIPRLSILIALEISEKAIICSLEFMFLRGYLIIIYNTIIDYRHHKIHLLKFIPNSNLTKTLGMSELGR